MEKKEMSMAQRRAAGLLWVDTGENMDQQVYARGLCQDFNHTRGTETEKREEILQKLFAFCGEGVWIEPPLTLAMGNTVSMGKGTYVNSNPTLVDDYEINIGEGVLIAPQCYHQHHQSSHALYGTAAWRNVLQEGGD